LGGNKKINQYFYSPGTNSKWLKSDSKDFYNVTKNSILFINSNSIYPVLNIDNNQKCSLILILEWFLKDHVTLKMLKIQE